MSAIKANRTGQQFLLSVWFRMQVKKGHFTSVITSGKKTLLKVYVKIKSLVGGTLPFDNVKNGSIIPKAGHCIKNKMNFNSKILQCLTLSPSIKFHHPKTKKIELC